MSQRYPVADTVAGSAAATVAKEKLDLYGPEVLPLVFATYGRLGSEGHHTLDVLQAALRNQVEDGVAMTSAETLLISHNWCSDKLGRIGNRHKKCRNLTDVKRTCLWSNNVR